MSAHEITRVLEDAVRGDAGAVDQLFGLLYGELHERAHGQRRRWHGNLTMNTTALVNEAYIKLAGDGLPLNDRAHFLALASRAMRQVLLDYARRCTSRKRGGDTPDQSLDESRPFSVGLDPRMADEVLDLEEALSRLEADNPDGARVVECRFFGGMTVEETAAALGISTPTVKRRWAVARAWLFGRMSGD